jgi:hypothetical protein
MTAVDMTLTSACRWLRSLHVGDLLSERRKGCDAAVTAVIIFARCQRRLVMLWLCFSMQVFTLLLLPDTKHVPLEVVNKRWATHWLWKRVHNTHHSHQDDSLAADEAGRPTAAAAIAVATLPTEPDFHYP